MIGLLPRSLNVNGKMYKINTDYRIALIIFTAYNDPDLSPQQAAAICLQCLYAEPELISEDEIQEAYNQAIWYLDGSEIGDNTESSKKQQSSRKLLDWEQDEKILFSAINKVAGKEVRELEYMHWWTFLAYYNEIGEGLLSTVIHIREKLVNRKKLDKWEQEIYSKNKQLIDIKPKLTRQQKSEKERLLRYLAQFD